MWDYKWLGRLEVFSIRGLIAIVIELIRMQQTERSEEFSERGSKAPQIDGKGVVAPRPKEEFGGSVWSEKKTIEVFHTKVGGMRGRCLHTL